MLALSYVSGRLKSPLRIFRRCQPIHESRSGLRTGDVNGRRQDNRHDPHGVLRHDHSCAHVYVRWHDRYIYDLACKQFCLLLQKLCAHQHGCRARGANVHHEDSQRAHHVLLFYVRS